MVVRVLDGLAQQDDANALVLVLPRAEEEPQLDPRLALIDGRRVGDRAPVLGDAGAGAVEAAERLHEGTDELRPVEHDLHGSSIERPRTAHHVRTAGPPPVCGQDPLNPPEGGFTGCELAQDVA